MATNSNNARKYKNSKNLKQFPPTLKDISVLPRKKKSIKSYYNTKDGEKRLTPNADYRGETVACVCMACVCTHTMFWVFLCV